MSVQACAEIVRNGDPDRFLATMAAPPAARTILFPLYAFNVEVTRAPWVTKEPMLAQMRLQWWRDLLGGPRSAKDPARHEVAAALGFLDAGSAALLDGLIDARHWDIGTDPHADDAALDAYLDATAGNLAWTAARSLGAVEEDAVRRLARAAGLARYLAALPALKAAGKRPLTDDSPETVRGLARRYLGDMPRARSLSRPARIATLETWQARPLLTAILRDPARVERGAVGLSEGGKRLRLLAASV
ncbi:hypothetical protein OCGS_0734 [Oceaniovalibus guishaninsula JLT2003]|uniref:Phytoene/squalene synthetase n=1 Tax=Oceaniovalibus guishaninsula JLT2003 TaxID=1231392 RepID=K2HQF1_9RHOB|nr:squalene/phytoene synthase family protein [Oceaniovalibus guishaninsula]EKE45039.1 hypothetical protein OCGS_0734 [Oceaniovalibus guishaninsula JLT2003]